MKVGRRCYRYLFLEKTLYGYPLIPIFHRLCYYLRGRGSGNLGRAGTVVGDESSGIIHLVLDLWTGQTMLLHPYQYGNHRCGLCKGRPLFGVRVQL